MKHFIFAVILMVATLELRAQTGLSSLLVTNINALDFKVNISPTNAVTNIVKMNLSRSQFQAPVVPGDVWTLTNISGVYGGSTNIITNSIWGIDGSGHITPIVTNNAVIATNIIRAGHGVNTGSETWQTKSYVLTNGVNYLPVADWSQLQLISPSSDPSLVQIVLSNGWNTVQHLEIFNLTNAVPSQGAFTLTNLTPIPDSIGGGVVKLINNENWVATNGCGIELRFISPDWVEQFRSDVSGNPTFISNTFNNITVISNTTIRGRITINNINVTTNTLWTTNVVLGTTNLQPVDITLQPHTEKGWTIGTHATNWHSGALTNGESLISSRSVPDGDVNNNEIQIETKNATMAADVDIWTKTNSANLSRFSSINSINYEIVDNIVDGDLLSQWIWGTYPLTAIHPTATNGATPYSFNSAFSHTSGNLIQVGNGPGALNTNVFQLGFQGGMLVGPNSSNYMGNLLTQGESLISMRKPGTGGDINWNEVTVGATASGTFAAGMSFLDTYFRTNQATLFLGSWPSGGSMHGLTLYSDNAITEFGMTATNNTVTVGIRPDRADGNTPFVFGTSKIHTTGNLAEFSNSTTNRAMITALGSIQAYQGTEANPSLSFISDPATGFWNPSANNLGVMGGGTAVGVFGPTGLRLGSGSILGWTSGDPSLTSQVVEIQHGTGDPEAALNGNVGDLYLRYGGTAGLGTTLYTKYANSGGNTGWTNVAIGTGGGGGGGNMTNSGAAVVGMVPVATSTSGGSWTPTNALNLNSLTVQGNPVLTNASGSDSNWHTNSGVGTITPYGVPELKMTAIAQRLMDFTTTSNNVPFQWNLSSQYYADNGGYTDDVVSYGWNMATDAFGNQSLAVTNQPAFGIISERRFDGGGAFSSDFEYHLVRVLTNGTQDRVWTWNAERFSNRVKNAQRADWFRWVNSTTNNDLDVFADWNTADGLKFGPHDASFMQQLTFGSSYGTGGGYFLSTNAYVRSPMTIMADNATHVVFTNSSTAPAVSIISQGGTITTNLFEIHGGGQSVPYMQIFNTNYSTTISGIGFRPFNAGGAAIVDQSTNLVSFEIGLGNTVASFNSNSVAISKGATFSSGITNTGQIFSGSFGASGVITNSSSINSIVASGNVNHTIRSYGTTALTQLTLYNDNGYDADFETFGSSYSSSGPYQANGAALLATGTGGLSIYSSHPNGGGIKFFTPYSSTASAGVLDKYATLTLAGGLATAVFTTATNYTAAAGDSTILINGTGIITNTLPTAVSIKGREYLFKLITPATNGLIATTSSQLIDGATTYSLTASNKFVRVVSDNANWWIIGSN